MRLSDVFQRLVLESVQSLAPPSTYGRKRVLTDGEALRHIFTILRTGKQWRELDRLVVFFLKARTPCEHELCGLASTDPEPVDIVGAVDRLQRWHGEQFPHILFTPVQTTP